MILWSSHGKKFPERDKIKNSFYRQRKKERKKEREKKKNYKQTNWLKEKSNEIVRPRVGDLYSPLASI